MRSMLNTCDECAKDFDVVFNGSKSKCIVNNMSYMLWAKVKCFYAHVVMKFKSASAPGS